MYSFFINIAQAVDCNPATDICPVTANTDFMKMIEQISDTLIKIAIPIAVILIIWIGIQFFLAQGNPEKITKAKSSLLWLIVGLAILLIGKGFISLIESILNLGK